MCKVLALIAFLVCTGCANVKVEKADEHHGPLLDYVIKDYGGCVDKVYLRRGKLMYHMCF